MLAAHPDDEVLAIGGLLAALAARGVDVAVVSATDGEAAYAADGVMTTRELARVRTAELDRALGCLRLDQARHIRLHLPDSGLDGLEELMRARLEALVLDADVVIAPLDDDGHPDHDALGRATLATLGAVEAVRDPLEAPRPRPALWQYAVWAWHWSAPERPKAAEGLDWGRARVVHLSGVEQAAKQRAVSCFVSQVDPAALGMEVGPVLPPEVLAHFDRDVEVVFLGHRPGPADTHAGVRCEQVRR